MLSRWPIKYKLRVGICLLLATVGLLALSGASALRSYRHFTAEISRRSDELPLVTALHASIAALQINLQSQRRQQESLRLPALTLPETTVTLDVRWMLNDVNRLAEQYRERLDRQDEGASLGRDEEKQILGRICERLTLIDQLVGEQRWLVDNHHTEEIETTATEARNLSMNLVELLQQRIKQLQLEGREAYRSMIARTWLTSALAAALLVVLLWLANRWIFRPLGVLVAGSREVAQDNFQYRIQLQSHDEMAELAQAMNDMTARFQEIRDDLDRQVRERTREVVQSERLASVGFLAAGVAHEINNPLAAIALAADSLGPRVARLLEALQPAGHPGGDAAGDLADDGPEPLDDEEREAQLTVVRKYLQRIKEESFRCKGITERLLDFSRLGNMRRERTDLRELVSSVIDMLRDLGKYRGRHIEFHCDERVTAWISGQEIKQVVLNLITNALDSLDQGGTVRVRLAARPQAAQIIVEDNGCGMSEEVQQHLFEPFFTRRRDGQGTGLGLSITYRIVTDHGGRIEAQSAGPGKGSTMRVTLPTGPTHEQAERVGQVA